MLTAQANEAELVPAEVCSLWEQIEAAVMSIQARSGREASRFGHLAEEATRLAHRADRTVYQPKDRIATMREILRRCRALQRTLDEAEQAPARRKMVLDPSERRLPPGAPSIEWCRPL